MPKKYGVKEKDLVVSHVVNLVLSGKLRSGDRLDRNEIAEQLGLSRVPIQEAVVQLEHDGVLSTRYHRGAFVERFDADSVLENHELYGVLNGIASARAAANPSARLLHRLDILDDKLRTANGPRKFHQIAWTYRKTINDEYAGPRLQAAIKASRLLVPTSFWTTGLDGQAELLPSYTAETVAIHAGKADDARDACVGRSEVMGRLMLAELIRRRVLPPAGSPVTSGVFRSE
jgi:DNA-binding GntR family transcriptional regulator